MPSFMPLRQVVLKKKISIIFGVFLLLKPRTSIFSSGNETVLVILIEGHLSNNSMKFE